jgi:outer membrane protein TolC
MFKAARLLTTAAAMIAILSGCTVHPQGERAERDAARQAGKSFAHHASTQPSLSENPTPDDLVRYALLNNADLQQRYWDWRSAIEQIPQDGTQATNLAINAGTTFSDGAFSRDRTMLGASNDPMADIVWPQKLSVAAKRALENARAAGLRFQKAKLELRSNVLDAYYDYALTAELIRLEKANAELLQTTATTVEARNQTGTGTQADLLKARNELDLSRNDITNMKSQLPAQLAALNALLNRSPDAQLRVPAQLPPVRPMEYSDEQLLSLAEKENPELNALTHETTARNESVKLAKLQYVPDFSASAGTDLAGITQSLAGMVTVPLLRYEAINAAIAQAEANLKSMQALRHQTGNDINAQIVLDISTIHDADRQLDLFHRTILPQAQEAVSITRSSYEVGQSTLLDFLDSERSLIALQRVVANLQIVREKRLNDVQKIVGS